METVAGNLFYLVKTSFYIENSLQIVFFACLSQRFGIISTDFKPLVTRWIWLFHRWHRFKRFFDAIGYNCEISISPLSDPIDTSTSKKKPIQKKEPKGTPGKRKSLLRNHLLWQYFDQEENSQEVRPRAVCKTCGTFVKRSDGSTYLMMGHLEKYHPDLKKEYLMLVTKANLEKVKSMLNIRSYTV